MFKLNLQVFFLFPHMMFDGIDELNKTILSIFHISYRRPAILNLLNFPFLDKILSAIMKL